MKPLETYENRKMSSRMEDKVNVSISEDERDIIDGTTLYTCLSYGSRENDRLETANEINYRLETANEINDRLDAETSNSFTSPTTAVLMRENNQVLCPLIQKTGPLINKYSGSYAKLTFVSPSTDIEYETMDSSYITAESGQLDRKDRGEIVCTCCNQCKYCRIIAGLDKRKNLIEVCTQTELNLASAATNPSENSNPNQYATIIGEPRAGRVLCTYVAETSHEFYPLSKVAPEKLSEKPSETTPVFPSARMDLPKERRRLEFKDKESNSAVDSNDLFLKYLKVLVLRQKDEVSAEFWDTYGAIFDESPARMTTKELDLCRRRFGEKFDVIQLERMFPSALKSTSVVWRCEASKCPSQSNERAKCNGETPPSTPKDQYVRIDRTDAFRSAKATERHRPVVKKDRRLSVQLMSIPSSSPISIARVTSQAATKSPRVKLNRAALLRADAIFSKYWRTN